MKCKTPTCFNAARFSDYCCACEEPVTCQNCDGAVAEGEDLCAGCAQEEAEECHTMAVELLSELDASEECKCGIRRNACEYHHA